MSFFLAFFRALVSSKNYNIYEFALDSHFLAMAALHSLFEYRTNVYCIILLSRLCHCSVPAPHSNSLIQCNIINEKTCLKCHCSTFRIIPTTTETRTNNENKEINLFYF